MPKQAKIERQGVEEAATTIRVQVRGRGEIVCPREAKLWGTREQTDESNGDQGLKGLNGEGRGQE